VCCDDCVNDDVLQLADDDRVLEDVVGADVDSVCWCMVLKC